MPRRDDDFKDNGDPKRKWWQHWYTSIPGALEYDVTKGHKKRKNLKGEEITYDQMIDNEVERRNRYRTSAQGKLTRDDIIRELQGEKADRKDKKNYAQPTNNETLPPGWNRWPNTYYALQAQGYFAGANKQEMDMVLDMARRGWLDGSPNGNHNRKERMATRVAMKKGFGADWWTFPWAAWREDYARFH